MGLFRAQVARGRPAGGRGKGALREGGRGGRRTKKRGRITRKGRCEVKGAGWQGEKGGGRLGVINGEKRENRRSRNKK